MSGSPIAPTASAWHGAPLASFASRAGAFLLDVAILVIASAVVIVGVVFVVLAGGADLEGEIEAVDVLGVAFVVGVYVIVLVATSLYAPLLMARKGAHNGQTLGKQAFGIRVVYVLDPQMSFGRAALREIVMKGVVFGFGGAFTAGLAGVLDLLWPLWDPERRALHDMLAATRVVRA